jgi:hypothetical protein
VRNGCPDAKNADIILVLVLVLVLALPLPNVPGSLVSGRPTTGAQIRNVSIESMCARIMSLYVGTVFLSSCMRHEAQNICAVGGFLHVIGMDNGYYVGPSIPCSTDGCRWLTQFALPLNHLVGMHARVPSPGSLGWH